jgi:hypothetical protein
VGESGGAKVSMEGVTFSNFIIADLMTSLTDSKRFKEVALVKAEEGTIEDVRVVQFPLNATLVD